jgi:hypothetical protein
LPTNTYIEIFVSQNKVNLMKLLIPSKSEVKPQLIETNTISISPVLNYGTQLK